MLLEEVMDYKKKKGIPNDEKLYVSSLRIKLNFEELCELYPDMEVSLFTHGFDVNYNFSMTKT